MNRMVLSAARHLKLLLSLLIPILSASASAQDIEVPVSIQVPLFLKVMSFDRANRTGPSPVIGIAFQGGSQRSLRVQQEVARELKALARAEGSIQIVLIDLDKLDIGQALDQTRINLLYLTPLRGYDLRSVTEAARINGVTTVTGIPEYVTTGVAISVKRLGEGSKLVINLTAARLEGADFSSELLKLAQIVR